MSFKQTRNAANDIRKRELAQIHIAKQQLGLDDETYRQMLWTVARVASSKDLDWVGRKTVIDHLKAKGFKIKPAKNADTTRSLADDELSKKIRALWIELHAAGAVRDSSEKALGSYVKRMTRVSALQWLNAKQASVIIESLKSWLGRHI